MKRIARLILACLSVVAMVFFHLVFVSVLPVPLRSLNVLFGAVILYLVLTGKGGAVWLAFATNGILELYASTPFGIQMFSSVISVLISFWALRELFINSSWYAVAAISAGSLAFYRILYTLILFLFNPPGYPFPSLRFLAAAYGWEMALTASFVTVSYIAIHAALRRPER